MNLTSNIFQNKIKIQSNRKSIGGSLDSTQMFHLSASVLFIGKKESESDKIFDLRLKLRSPRILLADVAAT